MAALYSNELKAVVILANIIDNPQSILKEQCFTVQKFDYSCVYKRTEKGDIYGAMNPVVMTFTVRVGDELDALKFIKALAENELTSLSFFFDATFDTNLRLKDYKEGMVMVGHVVGVEENYSTEKDQSGEDQQMLLNVKLLISMVTYLGAENSSDLKGVFIKKQ